MANGAAANAPVKPCDLWKLSPISDDNVLYEARLCAFEGVQEADLPEMMAVTGETVGDAL